MESRLNPSQARMKNGKSVEKCRVWTEWRIISTPSLQTLLDFQPSRAFPGLSLDQASLPRVFEHAVSDCDTPSFAPCSRPLVVARPVSDSRHLRFCLPFGPALYARREAI
ncbi:hypothetical protein N7532_005665 [Penicillium argentinense]|uniref:Uncharacterized protein n=1 Tax=Penicillium argentinense TaxID=1131581 RepID=A0A9W9FEG5_9EURO|nr:uncharacterized protein N7532_005665 [Penicillium argentinense]KAJ5098664.1 hypothetical protein N7532_005665 [Penicillium argentinense]